MRELVGMLSETPKEVPTMEQVNRALLSKGDTQPPCPGRFKNGIFVGFLRTQA